MAKYNISPFGNISGEVLGVVASSNKGIKFLRNKGKAADAKTEKQLARRAIYQEFCKLWDKKQVAENDTDFETAGMKENIFQNTLSFTLKFSESASMLWLAAYPTKGTMSAPVFTKTDFEILEKKVIRVSGIFLFPAFDESGDFELFSAFFGQQYYNYTYEKVVLEVYSQGKITTREIPFSAKTPNTTQSMLLGQKVFRSWWYINKKTGQISKPLCITIDESGNVETFYPYGK